VFAAAHLDNFLFLLFIAVAIFFQLLTRAATKSGRRARRDVPPGRGRSTSLPQTPRPTAVEAEETDEDRIRKFLEALGQPTTSKPPPPVVPRPTYQRPTPLKSPLPPLKTRPPELPPEVRIPSQPAPARQRKVFPSKSEVPAFEVQEGSSPLAPISESEGTAAFQPVTAVPISKRTERKIDLTSMLKSPSGLRDAIILREIFGPPRSMQPLDLIGNV
jgi:hypothetical protein